MWGKKRPSGNESSLDWRKNLVNFLGKGGKFEKNDDGERLSKVGTSSYEPFDEKNILASPDAVPDGDALQLWDGLHTNTKGNFLRVLLPDGTSTVVVGESGKSLKDTLQDICKKKNITLSTFDVTIGGNKEVASLNMDISTLSDTVICLERRILFRFDLPNGRSVGVKANPSKTLAAILQPVMRKNGFELHHYSVHIMNSKSALPLHSSISIAENKRLVARVLHKKLEKQTSDSAAMKQGSDIRSSFRRFRTNSFKEEKLRTEKQSSEKHSDVQRIHSNEKVKHSLLGRTKSNDEDGASALMSVLQRSQSGRLDDQRGTLIHDLEMPEFLKVTYSTPLVTRSKPLSTSADSSPMHGKYAGSYPASPVIVDRRMMNLPFDEQMESRLNSSMNSGFYSVTSWKEVESPDREIIDNTFASDACFDTVGDKNIITDNRAYLLELSKSHPSLQQENTKQRLCKENSAPTTQQTASINNEDHNVDIRRTPKFPLPNDLHSSSRMIFQRPIALENTEFSVKSPPCTKPKTLSTPPMSQKLDISKKTETSMRPKSITNYSEKEVLMGLEKDGYEIICTNDTRKGNKSLVPSSQQEAANYSTNESSGMISLPDMNSPPNGTQNTSGYMLDKDSVFQVNAVPTPDKGRLLNGETVLSRKNEKITFV